MKRRRLEGFLDSIADRGRELLSRHVPAYGLRSLEAMCRALLTSRGEASGTALSREVLRAYEQMDPRRRLQFFEMLVRQFGPDAAAIQEAANEYFRTKELEAFLKLSAAVEPPRQELFRRINRAPNGTALLVAMRAELIELLPQHPKLRAVDADLRHLFGSWFNRGFLTLERISWHSPADVLEKLIRYDTVHEIQSWDDLRRRLAPDRRCFAFFHPALPFEPLIFLEVALVRGMAREVPPLLDLAAPVLDPLAADTAIFYSINNTQRGLRGLSFGDFLIKQVLLEILAELPGVKLFATLSPLPGFGAMLQAAVRGTDSVYTRARLDALLAEFQEPLAQASGIDQPGEALMNLLERGDAQHRKLLAEPLERLALAYLTLVPREHEGFDPVAAFHLSNGARLERINPFADPSPRMMQASYGVMVNYRYEPDDVIDNHERFVGNGEVAMSRRLARLQERIAGIWRAGTAVTERVERWNS